MAQDLRTSRGGFVVVKLMIDGTICLLLRRNLKWKDLNLIGGHEKPRDQGNLARAAQRELWEEVPSVRNMDGLHLQPLTAELNMGPVFSRSAGEDTYYEIQFFLLKIEHDPTSLLEGLGVRTKNVLIPESDVLRKGVRVSRLVSFLDENVPEGIPAIPLSSPVNIHPKSGWARRFREQLEILF
jgi:hypothetical protein